MYRAVDPAGCTNEFMPSAKRDVSAAKRLVKKMVRGDHRRLPFTIGTDNHASYPETFASSAKVKVLPFDRKLRRVKYLNNIIEALHMMRKGQVKRLDGRDAVGQAEFVASLFGVAA